MNAKSVGHVFTPLNNVYIINFFRIKGIIKIKPVSIT